MSKPDEERALRLHRESLIFISHDHDLLQRDIQAMCAGGVTAKQLHISLDGQLWADKATFLRTATRSSLLGEAARHKGERSDDGAVDGLLEQVSERPGSDGFLRRAMIAMDYVYWQIADSRGSVTLALEPEDIRRASANGAVALLLGSEGSRLIEGRLEVLRMLHRLGLRHLELSWAWDNGVGAPQSDTSGRGLSPFGRELVTELNRLGMIVDPAHLAHRAIQDVIEVSEAPVLVSHSGAVALNPEGAATTLLFDDEIRALAAKGGVVAVHFMSQMVKPGRDKATLGQLIRHFEHIAELVGIDHVACAPDYFREDPRSWKNQGLASSFTYAEGVEDITKFLNVTRGLVAAGFADSEIEKILGGNLLRLFESVRTMSAPEEREYVPAAAGIGACTDGTTPL